MSHPLTFECEHCCQLAFTMPIPPAPTGSQRHPLSNPLEWDRKNSMQCSNCYKCKKEGATLSKCAACKIDQYCSRECQKAHWKLHKPKCLQTQSLDSDPSTPQEVKDTASILRIFCRRHRPTLADAAPLALGLQQDPNRANTHFFTVIVRRRPESSAQRPETAFWAIHGEAVAWDSVPADAFRVQTLKKQVELDNQHVATLNDDARCVFGMMVHCLETGTCNMSTIVVDDALLRVPYRSDWRVWMLNRMNEGIVS